MSFEQHPEEKRLQEIINDPSASDYDKGHAANRLAHGIWHRNDYPQSLSYGILAQQYFEKINDQLNIADSLYSQGESHLGMKAYRDASECYEAAAQIFRVEMNQMFLARSVQRKAYCLLELKQPKQSADCYLEAANLFLSIDDFENTAYMFMNAAGELTQIHEYEQAELYATSALEYFQKADEDIQLPEVYLRRAQALAQQKNFEAAEKDLVAGLTVAGYQDSTPEIAFHNLELASVYIELGRFEEAEYAIERSKAAYAKTNSAQGQAGCDLTMARILERQGRLLEALEKLQECRTLVTFSYPEAGFTADWLFATVNAKLGEFDAALTAFEQAVKTLTKLPEVVENASDFWIEYAELMLQTPNHAGALEKLDRVDFVEHLKPVQRVRYQSLRARAHLLLSHFDQALEVVDLGLNAIGDDTQHPYLGALLETKARALCDRGDLGEGLPAMQNAINAHLISGSVDSARYLAIEFRNLSNPTSETFETPADQPQLWGDAGQAA